jgi:hypothetical protein
MTPARPLREVFAGLAGQPSADPGEVLAAHGHPDLPADLVAEAVVSYADTAPPEVAEHLAPFVTAHSAVPTGDEPADWHDLLSTVPDVSEVDSPFEPDFGTGAEHLPADPVASLDFGAGAEDDHHIGLDLPDEPESPLHHEHHAADLDWLPEHHDPAVLDEHHHHHVVGDDDLPEPDDAG